MLKQLSDDDIHTRLVQDLLARLHTFTESPKRRKRSSETSELLQKINAGIETSYVGLSKSAKKKMLVVVSSLAQKHWEHKLETPFVSSLRVPTHESPVITILSTYLNHGARTSCEQKILALLVAYSIDCNINPEKTQRYTDQIQTWAEYLQVNCNFIKGVERLGRFCMGLLGIDDPYDCEHLEPVGLGALAMMDSHTEGLMILSNHGRQLLKACKTVPGFEAEAMKRSPAVCAGIRRVCKLSCFDLDEQSALGRLLAMEQTDGDSTPYLDQGLLNLLCHLDAAGISVKNLRRAFVAQQRWNNNGEREAHHAEYMRNGHTLAHFASDETLQRTITSLRQSAQISDEQQGILVVRKTVRERVLNKLSDDQKQEWESLAVALVCHAFPRGKTLDAE